MRVITHCPACQTQFFATDEQLNKHGGKVRCGHCRHIFDAKSHQVSVTTDNIEDASKTSISFKDIMSPADTSTSNQQPSEFAAIPAAKIALAKDTQSTPGLDINPANQKHRTSKPVRQQPGYVGDTLKNSEFSHKRFAFAAQRWLWASACLAMVLITCVTSIYFLRNDIANYYPKLKPYLVKICQQFSCTIELPKTIELIVIDDSDMQEDVEHSGLVRFSSKLINTGIYHLQYPNLELTLTDVDDKPLLRRIFEPTEYLATDINITDGFKAGEEVSINLAITTSDIAVAGYRVFVTY